MRIYLGKTVAVTHCCRITVGKINCKDLNEWGDGLGKIIPFLQEKAIGLAFFISSTEGCMLRKCFFSCLLTTVSASSVIIFLLLNPYFAVNKCCWRITVWFRIEGCCRKGYWKSLLQKINYAQVVVMLKEYPGVLLMAVVGFILNFWQSWGIWQEKRLYQLALQKDCLGLWER